MKSWVHISEQTIALATSRAEVLGELARDLAPGGWVAEPLDWKPDRTRGGAHVRVDIPDSPAGLLA